MPIPTKTAKKSAITYPKVTTWDILKTLGNLAKKHKFSLIISTIAMAASAVIQIITPLYYKRFFDTISLDEIPSVLAPDLTRIVISILILNVVMLALIRVCDSFSLYFISRMMVVVRMTSFEYMLGHAYSFFSNSFTGGLTQRVNRFARSLQQLTNHFIDEILPIVIKIVGIVIVLATFDMRVALVVIAWLIIFMGFNYGLARWKLKYDVASAELDSKLTGTLSDAISNHTSIQLFTGYKTELNAFGQVNSEWRKLTSFRWTIDNIVNAIQFTLMIGIEFFLFYYGIKYWEQGIITIGAFVLIQSYVLNLTFSLWSFGRLIRSIYESFADAREMVEILKLEHEIRDIPNAPVLIAKDAQIDFKDVIFGFNPTRTVVNKLNLHIKGGEKVAFVGPSGAGKSTLVRLILRLYDIQGGEILIDDQNIAKVTQASLRDAVSLVPQDPILFHRTLMENIRYGRRDATDAEVMEAARLAHCDKFIDNFPQKYDTYVGERGVKLSGGERQRIAIARAILKNAPILILDEATSSLDSDSESLIQDALDVLMKGKTVIVIAHRLSTIRKMDRIIVIKDGAVLEEGTHEGLIEKPNGLYAKLWSLQAGGFLKEIDAEGQIIKEVEIEEDEEDTEK